MYFVVGRIMTGWCDTAGFLVSDGKEIIEVSKEQMSKECSKYLYVQSVDANNGDIVFYNFVDLEVLPQYKGNKCENNMAAVLTIHKVNNEINSIDMLLPNKEIKSFSNVAEIKQFVCNSKPTVRLFNAEIINNNIVVKYGVVIDNQTVNESDEFNIEGDVLKSCKLGFKTIKTIKSSYGYNRDRSIRIPDGVKVIGNKAFAYNEDIKKVILPPSIKIIEDSAFYKSSIESINLDNIEVLGSNSFAYCENLRSINNLNNIRNIGERAFMCCFRLCDIEIGKNLEVLGPVAFYASGTSKFVIPGGVEKINKNTFWSDIKVDKNMNVSDLGARYIDIVLEDGVKSIDNYALGGFGYITLHLPDSIEYIADDAFICRATHIVDHRHDFAGDWGQYQHYGITVGTQYGKIIICCNEGSYAYNYCKEKGYLLDHTYKGEDCFRVPHEKLEDRVM